MFVKIAKVSAEHHHDGFGISHPNPRLSWRFESTSIKDWRQQSYDITIVRKGENETYHVDSEESVLVPWPSSPLASREIAHVKVRANGQDGSQTEWASIRLEAAYLKSSDWIAKLISVPPQSDDEPKRPFRLRKTFHCSGKGTSGRLYATAHGIYQVEVNGHVVGDHVLAPGWQSYKHRLHYQVYDISSYLQSGENVIGAYVGEGWFAGRLGRPGTSNIWGNILGFLAQVEVDGQTACLTDGTWEYLEGPILSSEIYNGEVIDTKLEDPAWATIASNKVPSSKGYAEELPFPSALLIAPDVAPVRRIMEINPVEIITTPAGKKVLDFGQNLVGWLRIEKDLPGQEGEELLIRHAEVLEHGELGTRPLRTAKARDIIKLGGSTKGYEPRFTFHGFRYAEITGYDAVTIEDFTAIVISSDIRRTGIFNCSHPQISRLHENTVWSMRGNFVSVPTDCPQRDERLGWTGDIQIFAPTANYLFDTAGFLSSWLEDLEVDQRDNSGVVPVLIPNVPMPPGDRQNRPMAAWADAAVITPWDLYNSFGDKAILKRQWESMALWLDKGVPRDERGFYSLDVPQYADWLDPRSPPAYPGHGPTDGFFVANAYLIYVTDLAAKIATVLGKLEDAARYAGQANKLVTMFQDEYLTDSGRLVSDTQTAYLLALRFGLVDGKRIDAARNRLDWLVRWEAFKINTGFAGTPIILETLADNDMLNLAYRMLQERDDPSWLYPVKMGATTIWERWNSMLPDGSINPGQMTSFNHYALGSVCAFLHKTVGGLSPTSPGWKTALVRPRPGGTIREATTSFDSPYGKYSVHWKCEEDSKMVTEVTVPPNGQARVVLSGIDETVGSGNYVFESVWQPDPEWPPVPIQGPEVTPVPSHYIP